MLKCVAEFCLIGTFHLECTDLSQKPPAGMLWRCSNCSETLGSSLTAANYSEDEAERLTEDDEENFDYDEEFDDDNYDQDQELDDEEYTSDEGLYGSDQMSLVTGSEAGEPEEPTTPPESIAAVNLHTSLNPESNIADLSTPLRPVNTASNAFTPVNIGHTAGIVTPFAIRDLPPFTLDGPAPDVNGWPAYQVPVGWSETAFEDLAPFVIAETSITSLRALTPEHVATLEEWRAACPPSKLLPGLRHDSSVPPAAESHSVVPLSHLLARIDLETTRYWE